MLHMKNVQGVYKIYLHTLSPLHISETFKIMKNCKIRIWSLWVALKWVALK